MMGKKCDQGAAGSLITESMTRSNSTLYGDRGGIYGQGLVDDAAVWSFKSEVDNIFTELVLPLAQIESLNLDLLLTGFVLL